MTSDIAELVKINQWGELVQAGKFEADKAFMSLEATKQTFLKSPTHKTLKDVFSTPTATLATVKKYRGEEKTLAVIEHLIKSILSFLNVGRGMSEVQVATTAQMIFDDYFYLTIADLKVCFKYGMTGHYGQLFDRLDGMIIFNWLEQYAEERAQYAERESVKKMKAKIESDKATHMPEWLSKWVNEWTAKKKTAFEAKAESNDENLKFWNLQSFLQHIGRNNETDKEQLWQIWEARYLEQAPSLEFEAYAVYQSNLCLVAINKGEVKDWDSLINKN